MAEIIRVYKESFPAFRLIGRGYTNDDQGTNGSFSQKWDEWFEKNYFGDLEKLGPLSEMGDFV